MSLDVFVPQPRTVTLNDGREIGVLPLRLGQVPAFVKASKAVAPYLFVADYMVVLNDHPQDAAEMIVVATALSADQAADLWQDEAVRLLTAIYEVNADFFVQRLRPAMTAAAGEAAQRIATLKALLGAAFSQASDRSESDLTPP